MFNTIKEGCKLLWKAINKSIIKDGKFDPNYNLAWVVAPIGIGLSVYGILLKYNWQFNDVLFCSVLVFLSCFVLYIIFFSIIAHKLKKKEKVNQKEKIELLEKENLELLEKLEKQSKIIDELKKEKGYGLAVRKLYIAFTILNQYFYNKRNEVKKTKDEIEDEIKDILKSFCNCLSEIYTDKVGSKCSVSLKLIDQDFEKHRLESIVINFERDKESIVRDQDKNYSTHEHKVFNNTCFYEIAKAYMNREEDSLFYTNPSLISDISYKTSSLDCRINILPRSDKKQKKEGLKNPSERPKIWNTYLAYKSEIVAPILLANKPFENTLLGFLCVDCEDENVFNKEYDVPLLKGVADGIYEIITDFRSLI